MAAQSAYSRASIFLHWLMALMIIGNLAGGFLASSLFDSTDPGDRALAITIIGLHKSVGVTVLLLVVVRLGLGLREGVPPLPDHMTATERFLARSTHGGFYLLMIGIPLAGWVLVSASPRAPPTDWFGLVRWPDLPVARSEATAGAASEAHELLAIGAILLLVLHVAGALKHHWMDRDDVLTRMIPALRRRRS